MRFLSADPLTFPPGDSANEDGIVAVGGDLSPTRLVAAYQRGIFPWYSEGLPILWHCPDPRFVLVPERLHVPRSLRKLQKARPYRLTLDTAFEAVIDGCAKVKRPGQRGTWITRDMRRAYVALHQLGLAHSCEAWAGDELVGGLYGVSLGHVFFGESMFARADDASKLAFVTLVEWMRAWGVQLVDCQQETAHLARFGAEPWPRQRFLTVVEALAQQPTRRGPWRFDDQP
ncbi:MAG: leucyl/phenylalanyl-tRNA--protein transferase [Myxococcaceae bacterium]|jgi:leucyl/phenylalanyl-tRNA--protein transferase|nr:leucyl/phenylalanyl-tRNA--protein transferase [Myxococcaceae bacterium]